MYNLLLIRGLTRPFGAKIDQYTMEIDHDFLARLQIHFTYAERVAISDRLNNALELELQEIARKMQLRASYGYVRVQWRPARTLARRHANQRRVAHFLKQPIHRHIWQ